MVSGNLPIFPVEMRGTAKMAIHHSITMKPRSFIFIRSDKGKELVEQAIADGAIVVEPYDMKEMPFIQKSQYQRKVNIPIRYVLYKILVNPQFRLKGFRLIHLCKIAGVRSLIKDGRGFIGRWWRGYKGHKKC